MVIDNKQLFLDKEGFSFNSTFDELVSIISYNNQPIINKEKQFIVINNVSFMGYYFTLSLYFNNNLLYKIKLRPDFRLYLSEEELKNHDSNAVVDLSTRIIETLKSKYNNVKEQKFIEHLFLTENNLKIKLAYNREIDSFFIEVENA